MIVEVFLTVASFFLSLFLLKWWEKTTKKKGIFGIDVHKPFKPIVTEGGGTVILLVFSLMMLIYGVWLTFQNNLDARLIVILCTTLLAGLLGLLDHLVGIRWRDKILLPFIAALPLVIARVGHTTVNVPFFGMIEFGYLYTLVMIPLAVVGVINMVNMLAGYNGLEAGFGIINLFWLFVASLYIQDNLMVFVCLIALSSLLAFLKFNWYPAKIFPGDVGTFTWGAILVSVAIAGNMERFTVGLFSLYALNFFLFVFWQIIKAPFKKFADVDKDGYLKPPNPYTVYWILPYYFKLKEKTTVEILLLVQFLIGLLSFLILIYRW